MSRQIRKANGGIVYHILNRANGRLKIFKTSADFEAFERILAEGAERFKMRICAYCLMSNHWHLVLWPYNDGDLSVFMKWVTGTHSHRWHAAHGTVGIGHLYQGRFKSFPVQGNNYYLTLIRYIESNPQRAGLVKKCSQWQWSSVAIRTGANKAINLSEGPIKLPDNWINLIESMKGTQPEDIQVCINRGRPFGDSDWVSKTAENLGLNSSLKPKGRPKKE